MAVVVAVLAVAWWAERGGEAPEPTPEQVVSAFVQAQRDGDCVRLLDLVSEASWSAGGERSRAEFLDECEAALDGYEPTSQDVDLEEPEGADDDGRIEVTPVGPLPLDETYPGGPPRGMLVREGGRWRVRLDDRVLHLGRSVPETVRDYLDAYNDVDCERLVDFESDSEPRSGARSRADRVRRCERDAERLRRFGPPPELDVHAVVVTEMDDGRAEAEVSVTTNTGHSPLEPETLQLARDGLRWRLARSEDLPDDWAGRPLRAVAYAELETLMVDEVAANTVCSAHYDGGLPGPSTVGGAVVGINRRFTSCHAADGRTGTAANVGVYRFADDEEAGRAARSRADALASEPLPTARELDESEAERLDDGRDRSLAEWQDDIDSRRPSQRIAVPGVPGALGVRSRCDLEGCATVSVFAARGPLVVSVTLESDDVADAAAILRAQMARL